jgi:hypothetical protein
MEQEQISKEQECMEKEQQQGELEQEEDGYKLCTHFVHLLWLLLLLARKEGEEGGTGQGKKEGGGAGWQERQEAARYGLGPCRIPYVNGCTERMQETWQLAVYVK